jgi:hypothetical protein
MDACYYVYTDKFVVNLFKFIVSGSVWVQIHYILSIKFKTACSQLSKCRVYQLYLKTLNNVKHNNCVKALYSKRPGSIPTASANNKVKW